MLLRHQAEYANFWKGNSGRKAVFDHVTAASWQSVVSCFRNPASQRSAHFQVRKDGMIDQFVSVEDSAWANGASWTGNSRTTGPPHQPDLARHDTAHEPQPRDG